MVTTDGVGTFQTFRIRPQMLEYGKTTKMLTRTDLASAGVQVIASGGETNLHAHTAEDAVWLVLNGVARFYTTDDREVATLNAFEGLTIPRGSPYWFESGSEENLVILRFAAKSQRDPDDRVNYTKRNFSADGQQPAQRPTKVKEGKFFGASEG
jgi:mannose-6-phosphate isomerase-like protein (cupin superfamily)